MQLQSNLKNLKIVEIEGPHEPKKYTIDDLKDLIAKYKLKCKELE